SSDLVRDGGSEFVTFSAGTTNRQILFREFRFWGVCLVCGGFGVFLGVFGLWGFFGVCVGCVGGVVFGLVFCGVFGLWVVGWCFFCVFFFFF
ncbi:hypothetical protein ACJEJG_26340, partial [Escherichia coli]